jgi:hypothetical protein
MHHACTHSGVRDNAVQTLLPRHHDGRSRPWPPAVGIDGDAFILKWGLVAGCSKLVNRTVPVEKRIVPNLRKLLFFLFSGG